MAFNVTKLNQYWTDIYFLLHYPHEDKITHQAIRIMQLVDKREKIGVREVAEYMGISHNTASEHIKRIIDKSLLVKQRDPADERRVTLKLTKMGKEVLIRNTSLDESKLSMVLEDLSQEDVEILDTAFNLLKERARNVHDR